MARSGPFPSRTWPGYVLVNAARTRCRRTRLMIGVGQTEKVDLNQQRLDLAGTRGFTAPGAGEARRAAMAELSRVWIHEIWTAATYGARTDGVALASVGSLARGDAGPLSDFDLVLLHDGRSMSGKEITSLADRIWYPIWDGGASLDHSVRTVGECRSVAAGDLSAAVGLLDLELVAGDAAALT